MKKMMIPILLRTQRNEKKVTLMQIFQKCCTTVSPPHGITCLGRQFTQHSCLNKEIRKFRRLTRKKVRCEVVEECSQCCGHLVQQLGRIPRATTAQSLPYQLERNWPPLRLLGQSGEFLSG